MRSLLSLLPCTIVLRNMDLVKQTFLREERIGQSPIGDPWRVAYGIEPGLSDEWVWKDAQERVKLVMLVPEPNFKVVQAAQYRVHQR